VYAEIYASTQVKIVRQIIIVRLKLNDLDLKFRISSEKILIINNNFFIALRFFVTILIKTTKESIHKQEN
jgi:hypothetical protein